MVLSRVKTVITTAETIIKRARKVSLLPVLVLNKLNKKLTLIVVLTWNLIQIAVKFHK